MRHRPNPSLIKKRTAQRAHAKKRFQQRFDLDLNRDRIHAIELRIQHRQAIQVGKRSSGRSTWLVEVDRKLVLVAYDKTTQRLVTALPEECLENVPPETLRIARIWLLPQVQEEIAADILSGKATLIWARHDDLAYYQLEYDGEPLDIGYRKSTGALVKYEEKRGKKRRAAVPVIQTADAPRPAETTAASTPAAGAATEPEDAPPPPAP